MSELIKFNKYKKNLRNTKWEFIFIINDFQEYLHFKQLRDISVLNKYLRRKLKNKVFKSIKLSRFYPLTLPNCFDNANNEFSNTAGSINTRKYKISLFTDMLIRIFDKFSSHCNSLSFLDLGIAGYHIIPKICYFNHLTYLKIFDCLMGLKNFIQLMGKLENLQYLELYELNFIKFQDEGVAEGNIIIPATLKGIALTDLKVFTVECLSEPYVIISNYSSDILEIARIPPQHLSNLFKLQIFNAIDDLNFILEFLFLNPQLSEIILPIKNFSIEVIKALSEIGNVKHLKIDFVCYEMHYPNNVALPKLSSLSSLKILYITESNYYTILKLLEAFPNLTKLIITLKQYNADFITGALKKLNNLKCVKLVVYSLLSDEFNFNVFSNIEVLNAKFRDNTKVLYKLPLQPCKLKSIIIAPNSRYLENMNYMLEDNEAINNWDIKLLGQSINCTAKKT